MSERLTFGLGAGNGGGAQSSTWPTGLERLAFGGSSLVYAPDHRPAALPAGNLVKPDEARLERLDGAAFKGLLAFTFVLFVRPQDQLRFLDPLHLADLTAPFALIALAAGRLGRGAPITRITRELLCILGIAAVMLVTAPFSVWPGGAVAVFTDLYIKVILVYVLMINTLTTRARLDRFVNIVIVGTSYIAVRTVLDYLRGINLVEGGRAAGAVGGLFGNPNDMALNMVAFLPLAIIVALRRGQPVLRLVALIGLPAIAAAIIFSKSRGGTVGLVAMLLVLLYQMRRVRPGIAALVVAAGIVTIPMLPSSFTERMSSIFNPEEDPTGSREARKRLLRDGYQAFRENPVLGLGAGQFMNYNPEGRKEEAWRETHNAVLQVASELGVVGLVIFVVLVGSGFAGALRAGATLRRARRRGSTREPRTSRAQLQPRELFAAAVVASLTGWVMAAMFASVAYYWTLYLVLGIAAANRDITAREMGTGIRAKRVPWRAAA